MHEETSGFKITACVGLSLLLGATSVVASDLSDIISELSAELRVGFS